MLKKLGSVKQTIAPPSKISANEVASRLVQNSKHNLAKQRPKYVKKELYRKRKSMSTNADYPGEFTMSELDSAIKI